MEQSKQSLSDELVVLLNRLALNGDIHIAGHVLYAYVSRFWRLERDVAKQYVIQYPKQLQWYLKNRKKIKS